MCYAACTDADIAFLNTRVAGRGKNQPKLARKNFRNVPIITAYNLSKDTVNALGSKRFAEDHKEELVSFYSHDHFKRVEKDTTTKSGRRAVKGVRNVRRKNSTIPIDQQEQIWDLWPSSTDHIAGRLDLCRGMPVMLRYNEATECGVTKGAEAIVVGWHSSEMRENRPILDTVFVQLSNPAKDVQLEGLPVNVIPITRKTEDVLVVLGNGESISITRNQVPLLLNFSMTDYSAQGRTRPYNVVDLQNCRDHLSYYVALSRSATAEGTIIVQHFDSRKIREGISGWLRQEFRELELLDEITKMRYENTLPVEVRGNTQILLIKSFQKWKGVDFVPVNTHPSLAWSINQPMHTMPDEEGTTWYTVEQKKKRSTAEIKRAASKRDSMQRTYKQALGSTQVPLSDVTSKRKASEMDAVDDSERDAKRSKQDGSEVPDGSNNLIGFDWDRLNWSCAYDALFGILGSIWTIKPKKWTTVLRAMNPLMKELARGFQQISVGVVKPAVARNRVRKLLHSARPVSYPYGQTGCGTQELSEDMLVGTGGERINCGDERDVSTQAAVDNVQDGVFARICAECGGDVYRSMPFKGPVKLISCGLESHNILIKDALVIKSTEVANLCRLTLRGVIYYKDYHFMSRFWDTHGNVWFHNGKAARGAWVKEVDDGMMSEDK
ncbi:hypothetical protein FIBSPDRAFT_759033 [Athelia psychrophila]|uniref:Uncharacterized protein n=1 Tax=Athelia psychrophila TaxID=1759441 RepID=A0A165YY60_9AGAM|nr:hypothetical protein FIBSPDRAFT_759033 [Fibularhizoctonia sp. CBS 109695]